MNGKEKIHLSDIHEQTYPDDWVGFKLVYKDQVDFDSEKGFVDIECVIQRESDKKFFKFEYTDYGRGDTNLLEAKATEVQQKSKLIYYYE